MPKALDFVQITEKLRVLLKARGPCSATEICHALDLSQASFSRLVRQMEGSLLALGRARKTRYALKRKISHVEDPIPLYSVNEEGRVLLLAELNPIEPKGFYLRPKSKNLQECLYTDLPYFLEDLRPSGFLGRLIPKVIPELECPSNILDWSIEDCLRYWTKYDWNPVGNLILGEKALQKFLQRVAASSKSLPSIGSYSECALQILRQGEPGSSAGGEQPKFIASSTENRSAVLVKFSPPVRDGVSSRIADLLRCEHLAHQILREHGFSAAHSRLVSESERIFLEVERFDRVGKWGRRGLISLKALSLEFVGTLDSWKAISAGLLKGKFISEDIHLQIVKLEIFGDLIANTDMHAGNLSFFLDESLKVGPLAPVYDMLPMAYAPRQSQILDYQYRPSIPMPQEFSIWKESAQMALQFWEKVVGDLGISTDFAAIASENTRILQSQVEITNQLAE